MSDEQTTDVPQSGALAHLRRNWKRYGLIAVAMLAAGIVRFQCTTDEDGKVHFGADVGVRAGARLMGVSVEAEAEAGVGEEAEPVAEPPADGDTPAAAPAPDDDPPRRTRPDFPRREPAIPPDLLDALEYLEGDGDDTADDDSEGDDDTD